MNTNFNTELVNNAKFKQSAELAINRANPNYLVSDISQATMSQASLEELKIKNIDEKTKIILSNIEMVLTSKAAFANLCQLDNQQLAVNYLNKLLATQSIEETRKWLLPVYPFNEFYAPAFPLETAAKYNNEAICKVIIGYFKQPVVSEVTHYFYKLSDVTICLYYSTRIFCRANNYTFAKYIYTFMINKIKNSYTTKSYSFTITDLLLEIQDIDFFNIVYQDSILLDKEIDKSQLFSILQHVLLECLIKNNKDLMLYILTKTIFFKEDNYQSYGKTFLYCCLKKKQFDILAKVFSIVPKSLLNNTRNYVYISYNYKECYDSIFYMTIKFLDAETLFFLLKATNFSIEETKISTLDYAILNGSYESACLLKQLNFKSTARNNTELTEEEQKKIQEFMSKPISLSKSAAIALGMKYINEQLTVEQAKQSIATGSLTLAKEVETIADVFLLNLIYPSSI